MRGGVWTEAAPRRVLLTTDAVGGVWQYTLEVAAACRRAGADVQLVAMGPVPDAVRRSEVERLGGVRLTHLDVPLDWTAGGEDALVRAADALRPLVSRFAPDLIHLSGASLAAFEWRAPVVATMHSCLLTWWAAMERGPLPDEWRWYGGAMARGLAAADRVIAPSAAYGRALETIYGSLPRLRVVHNGRREPCGAQRARKKPVALAAGRFWDAAKGLDCLDAAAAEMDTPLILAGPLDGPSGQRGVVHHAAARGALAEADLHALMEESAVFVSASRFEPFGLGVLEAAQRGSALVLSDIGTFRELWDGAAVFFPPGDTRALASAIDAVAAEPGQATRLGELARERARRYAAERMGRSTLDVYREAMAANLPPVAVGG